jgi:hypothetical protein
MPTVARICFTATHQPRQFPRVAANVYPKSYPGMYACGKSQAIIVSPKTFYSTYDSPVLISPLPSPRTQFYAAPADSGKFM